MTYGKVHTDPAPRPPYRERPIRDTDRQQQMATLYRGGWTLAQIGTLYGVTRERVRQVIAAAGLSRRDGGQHVRATRRKQNNKQHGSTS